jgi:site-specific recombinase XerD
MESEDYVGRIRLFRHLKNGPHGQLVERYARRLVEERFSGRSTRQCLNVVSGLLGWIAKRHCKLADIDDHMVERYLQHRARRHSFQLGDRAALRRWMSVLRDEGAIARAAVAPLTPQDRIIKEFEDYLRTERGLAPRSIVSHLLTIRRFLHEVCLNADDLGKIGQETVIGYIERHARDWSPSGGRAMCSSMRAFLRYLHYRGLNLRMLAGCVPLIRRWKHATLPTYLPAAQVQKVLDGCDRTTATGRRDYAILMILAKLGLRAGEVTTLTLDDIEWRTGEMQVCRKGGKRARMPIPPDVGAAVVAYLRNGRPKSSCRRLFVRTRAPHVGFVSHHAVTQIAKSALDRAGITGCTHRGAHIFRRYVASRTMSRNFCLCPILRRKSSVDHDIVRPLHRPFRETCSDIDLTGLATVADATAAPQRASD